MLRIAHCVSVSRRVLICTTTGRKEVAFAHFSGVARDRTSSSILTVENRYATRWTRSRTYATSSRPRGGKPSRYIQTLDPAQLQSADQQILTLSGVCEVHARPKAHYASVQSPPERRSLCLNFQTPATTPFPPETEGVFYYDSSQAQVRFRLCKTVEEFADGSDLKRPDSSTWNISLAKMARNNSRYGPLLALVKHEFPVKPQDVDSTHDMHRSVSTFSPQRLVEMDQPVFDISDYQGVTISPQGRAAACLTYTYDYAEGIAKRRPFPDNTIGVFYYRQSETLPTHIGELRFRLCSDIGAFDVGSDLLLPSGQPWCINSHSLQTAKHLQSLREHLVEEGLLDRDVYLGVPDAGPGSGATPLTGFRQPFVVDMSSTAFNVRLIGPNVEASPYNLRVFWAFRKQANGTGPLFSGRAVVCLERYPNPHPRDPLFVIRVLELLTPMKRLSASTDILDPTPGELLMHRHRGQYIPYGYSPLNADTRAAITAWIHAQSQSPPKSP